MTASTYPTIRLLSPTRRRICTVDAARAEKDPRLVLNLRTAGWIDYRGSAQTNARGWIIRGTDPAIDRIAKALSENLREEWDR